MKIALAQINSHLGDFSYNCDKILEYARKAKERRADIVLFSESTLFGYHPMDLLKRPSVVEEQIKFIKKIEKNAPENILIIFGAFTKNNSPQGKPYFNSALVVQKNKKTLRFNKELLPTYDVFDDARHIEPGDMTNNIFTYKGKKIFITICEDIWAWPLSKKNKQSNYSENPIKKIKPGSVDLVLNLSASPFCVGKKEKRLIVTGSTAKYFQTPMVYVNMVGAQDELIFDGGSFAINAKGEVILQCGHFCEELRMVDISVHEKGSSKKDQKSTIESDLFSHARVEPIEEIHKALVLGIRDFATKVGFKKIHLGLSGGIDSAVVACLAVDALGPASVKAYGLPGPFSTKDSLKLAQQLAQNIGVEFKSISIVNEYKSLIIKLNKTIGKTAFGLMHENLQARLRGIILMAICNKEDSLLLNTSNKSEIAAGYSTLYGDMVGGLSPIGDLLKSDVYALAEFYNSEVEVIPKKIITRAPSAELRKNQKDQDTLPPYDILDKAVVDLVEKSAPAKSKAEKFLLYSLMRSEFKRWQAPPILKVREFSFGQGRRMPIAHKGWY